MYARVRKTTDDTPTADGCVERLALRRLGGWEEVEVSLWTTREQAEADPTAEWYEVSLDQPGTATEPATTAALVWFDGPLSDELLAAANRASRERIGPAMADHPGAVRSLLLWQPDRRAQLSVVLATSIESIEDGQRKIMSMELLPGEDPALLPGANRVDIYRVVPAPSPVV
ncbi:MAG TPA: hypothetical protein VNP92_20310 [Actinophytocola sp.]|nr:hypothetical protein [Actinophytocola sp.]